MAMAAPGQLNVNESPSWGSRSVDCFEKLEQIGEGTYGSVFSDISRHSHFLILRVMWFIGRLDWENNLCTLIEFPITAIREIKILKKLHHENVIKLKEIVTSPGSNLLIDNEAEQLNKIFELCGAPDEVNWPGVSKTPCFDRHALELLEKMLTLDPAQQTDKLLLRAYDRNDIIWFWF
ncbi:Cyclin-dependent kinase C-1 [Spatholobus suberectus]|nr:Cyclin-dependent kinase C-1 [Spatholobus suberectus]